MDKHDLNNRLFCAAKEGDLSAIENALHEGADIHAKNDQEWSVLHFAVRDRCFLDCVKFIVEHGVNPNVTDNQGKTPIHLAVKLGALEVIEYLISQGADPVAKNNKGETTIMEAAISGDVECLNKLLPYCDDINAKDYTGLSAIAFSAADSRNLECVKTLIAFGADLSILYPNNKTLLDLCKDRGLPEISSYLQSVIDSRELDKVIGVDQSTSHDMDF